MTPERWHEIEELFHAALECAPAARPALLDAACASNVELRQRVEALLSAHEAAGDFIEAAPMAGAIAAVVQQSDGATEQMAVASQSLIGRRVGHYEIQALLGVGGMGEVYRARDVKLDRAVALKILSSQFTADDAHVRRFEREARAASALNNPHIITIHDIGQEGELHFIATELIEGRTLRQRLADGRLPITEVIALAAQIATALSAAHAAGIIHRDIKPENVMVRTDGLVKVLDFGLAKPLGGEAASRAAQTLPDDVLRTSPENFMGTVSYMSPEQVSRSEVDHRADLFALGVVLFEMATGNRPFKGETAAHIFNAILHNEPTIEETSQVPGDLQQVIGRALQKSKAARYQSADQLQDDLQKLARDRLRPQQKKASATLIVCGALALAALVYLAFRLNQRTGASVKPYVIKNSIPIAQEQGTENSPSLSPDGQWLVYSSATSGQWDIYRRRINDAEIVNLTSNYARHAIQPAYSPDGARIAFHSHGICTMDASGGDIKRLTDDGYNPAWSPDASEIAYATDRVISLDRTNIPSQLWAVNVETGVRRLLSQGDGVQPSWSPHGHRIAFWRLQRGGRRSVWTIAATGENAAPVADDDFENWNPVWSPDGQYLYFVSNRNGAMNLWRLPIDETTGKATGQAEPITIPSAYIQQLSFSRDGRRMAYERVDKKANIKQIAFDARAAKTTGEARWVTQGSSLATQPDISGDAQQLAFSSLGERHEDLYVLSELRAAGERFRLTDDIYKDEMPRWSPDGNRLAFFSDRSGNYEIWVINKDGSGLRQLTHEVSRYSVCPVWSPDGQRLAYYRNDNIFIIETGKDWAEQTPQALPEPDASLKTFLPASWSGDGLKLAGWRQPGAEHSAGIVVYDFEQRRYETLTDKGSSPRWLSDNRRLLFSDEGKLLIVDSMTRKIETVMEIAPSGFFGFALTRDDRQIYFTQASTEIDIWLSELQ